MNIRLRIANYISRYAPSRSKIIRYLQRKNIDNSSTLLEEMGYNEDLMCDMWFRTCITSGKSKGEIEKKLLQKGFPKEMIHEKLESTAYELYDWDIYRGGIMHQIQTLINRGKSQKYVQLIITSKFPYFRDEILECMSNYSDNVGLKKEIQRYKLKYNIALPAEKQKFYSALIRKGFGYGEIQDELKQ